MNDGIDLGGDAADTREIAGLDNQPAIELTGKTDADARATTLGDLSGNDVNEP